MPRDIWLYVFPVRRFRSVLVLDTPMGQWYFGQEITMDLKRCVVTPIFPSHTSIFRDRRLFSWMKVNRSNS